MADSLTTLKERIASELHRTNLTSEIASAISAAILQYRSRRFEFNEYSASFNTVSGTETYTSGDTGFPTDLGEIDTLRITVSGVRLLLRSLTYPELQSLSTTTTATGAPSSYAWYGQKLYLYPIPNAVYAILVSYKRRKAAPTSDADTTSVWTNEAEPLIRHCAKKLLARDVTFDPDLFARSKEAEGEALAVLLHESIQLQDEGGLAANW